MTRRSAVRGIIAGLSVIVGAVAVAPTAGAQQRVDQTSAPLQGGSFQGGDGNQADGSGFADWQTLQSQGRVRHTRDDGSLFTSGSTDNRPGSWDPTDTGVIDVGRAITDSWSSVETVGANTFVYLALAREAGTTGTGYNLTFELNRDDQPWRNTVGRYVPCRRDGDLLVTLQPRLTLIPLTYYVELYVQTWSTSVADPGTGCALEGRRSGHVTMTGQDIQAAVNGPGSIPNYLGGGYWGSTILVGAFGETAINVRNVLTRATGTPCGAFTSIWAHSRSSTAYNARLYDYVAPHQIEARPCSAAGTKWHDLNANGERDPGELGLAAFRIYADLNGNRQYDNGEPFSITDATGHYQIDGIRASGPYTLREEPIAATPEGPWTCSSPQPCEHTVDPGVEPIATGRDFGNWQPASVTLTKKVDPPDDPGRFDLSFGEHTLPDAGNGDSRTFENVRPGLYTPSEAPAEGTFGEDYDSWVACDRPSRLGRFRHARAFEPVELLSGEHVVCTFVNTRARSRSVTIRKSAPEFAEHGDTLQYEMHVTNTGQVALPAGEVEVTDTTCEPELGERLDSDGNDGSVDFMNPGDTWIYTCERPTERVDPDECEEDEVTNTARVRVPGAADSDRADTRLTCPPRPQPRVEIEKSGPATAETGTPLTYVFYVANTGDVSFANVTLTDTACDDEPELVARYDGDSEPDTSTGRFNPGDRWVYRCTNTMPPPGADCRPSVVTNTSTVVARSERHTAEASDSFNTELTCPPAPPEPPTPPPTPTPPSGSPQPRPEVPLPTVPIARSSRVPPRAGVAGRAGLTPRRGCLRRGSRVVVRGRRIASVRVLVGGRRIGHARLRALQRRARIRITRNLRPGRHRVTAVVRFQRGSDTPTVRLTRVMRACARRQPPPVTG